MSRTVVIGLTVLILTACGPADQTAPAESAAPEPVPAPVAPASAPEPAAPLSWEATQERYRQVEAEPSDRLEALEYRGVRCQHYSGEFGGDGSERDQWLNAQMDRLRCDELVTDARAMRASRSGEPDVISRVDAVIAVYEP